MVGMFAASRAGHDKGTLYIIVKETDEYVYVSDGRLKTFDNPKKKNKRHIQIIKKSDEILKEKLLNGQQLYNEEIRKAIGGLVCQNQM